MKIRLSEAVLYDLNVLSASNIYPKFLKVHFPLSDVILHSENYLIELFLSLISLILALNVQNSNLNFIRPIFILNGHNEMLHFIVPFAKMAFVTRALTCFVHFKY